jgi:hypothetical protein
MLCRYEVQATKAPKKNNQKMKKIQRALLAIGLSALATVAHAATYTVNTVDNTDFSAGKTNLVSALKLLKDGDTIQFAIAGAGVHTINTPPNGYPLITANNVTIDGYSQQQAGSTASPNTASLQETNNAQLMIALSSINGNALSMYSAVTNFAGIDYPNLGFGDSEQAILGFFRATNAWVKGLAFLAAPQTATTQSPDPTQNACKTICFAVDAPDVGSLACQGFHVSGCWFGVDPATRKVAYMPDGVTVASPSICIATYGTGANTNKNVENMPGPGIIGVAAGSANPRAEFNVLVTGYGLDSQGGPFRISGNFWNVLPDGTTLADISALNSGAQQGDAFVEFGGGHDILIGTDGDGVNDAYEGNVFGSYANGGVGVYFYGSQANVVIAGNTFGMDIHGKSFGVGQQTKLVHHFSNSSYVRFGSDFNGVSDALEANQVVDSLLFDVDTGSATNSHWISARGNSLVNTTTPGGSTPPIGDGQASAGGMDIYTNFIDVSSGNSTLAIIPVIDTGTTKSFLVGTCGKPLGEPYTRLIVDLYEADTTPSALPQGKKWLASFTDNSASDLDTNVAAFKFALPAGLVASGKQVTITVTYSSDTQPTLGPVHRLGNQTTVTVTNTTLLFTNRLGPVYGIMQSSSVTAPYTNIAAQTGTSATFTDNAQDSFYKASGTSATGQTSPFSALFTMP